MDVAYQHDNFDEAALVEESPAVASARERLQAAGIGAGVTDLEPIEFEDAADLFAMEFPPTSWLVRGLMTPDSVYAVAGEAKTSKTWAALELSMAVATGTKAFGEFHTNEPRPVVYYAVEDNKRSLRNRLRALAMSRKMDPASACRNLKFRSMQSLSLTSIHDLARLVAGIEQMKARPALLCMDPLRDLHGEEENDSTAMAKVTHALRAVRTVLGISVLFVHHSSKQSEGMKNRRPGQRMRGSSVIHGAVDGGLYLYDLKQEESDESHWKNTAFGEVKGAKQVGEFGLSLAVEDDEDGEAVAARWEVTKGGAKGAEIRSAVLAALQNSSPNDWTSVEAIRKTVAKSKSSVTSALYDLHRDGLAERSFARGHKSGWRIASDNRSNRSESFQNASSNRSRPLGRNDSIGFGGVLENGNGYGGQNDQ